MLSPLTTFSQSELVRNNYSPPDTVFNEIVLTEEGVTAIDTAGYEWYYDFEFSTFVSGLPPLPDDEIPPPLRPGDEYVDLPIHERATVPKKVKHFEMGPVTVHADEYVDGDIRSMGIVTVRGWVRGSVVSIGDRVLVTETGQVDGDIEAPKVVIKEGGVVLGQIREEDIPIQLKDLTSSFSHEFLLVMVILISSLMFLGFLALVLMPRQIANLEACQFRHKARSTALGVLFLIMMPAVIVLLTISIIGVVLVPLVPFVYSWAIILGVVSFGKGIGREVYSRIGGGQASPIFLGLAGIFLVMSPWLAAAALMGTSGGSAHGLGILFLVISILLLVYPVFSGIGAAYLTRFGFREYVSGKRYGHFRGPAPSPEPAPPPIPDAPITQNKETPAAGSRISQEKTDS